MLQQEFEQLTGIKVSAEDFETINEMYMNAGDDIDKQTFCKAYKNGSLIADMPKIIREIKIGVESAKDKERIRSIAKYQSEVDKTKGEIQIKYQNKIHDMEMQIAAKDEIILKKDDQLQEHLEVLTKTIKEYMNLGQYDMVSAFKPLFWNKGGEAAWVQFLCEIAKREN